MTRVFDLAVVLGLFIAAGGCGIWLLDGFRLRGNGRLQHVLFASGLGLGLLGYVTFALGMASLLRRPVITAAYVSFLALGLWGFWRFWRAWSPPPEELQVNPSRRSWPVWVLIGFLGLVAGINMLAALAPVVGVDELIYRLAAADLYLRHQRLFYIPSMWLHQQPQHVQMIQLWGMSLASDSTAQVVQWGMGLLLVTALVDFGRREMPLAWALLGAAVFYAFSDAINLSARASPDLANALFMVLSLFAWMLWLQNRARRWLILAAIFAGFFAAGSRLPGLYGIAGLAVLVAIFSWRRNGASFGTAIGKGLAVGGIAFLIVLPWYVKAYVQTGSPTWPVLMPLFGARDWTPAANAYVFDIQRMREVGPWLSLARLLAAPWDLTMRPQLFQSGTIGPLVLASLPFALVARKTPRMEWTLAACGVLAPLWYVSYPRLRAFMPGIALLSVVAVWFLWRSWESGLPRSARMLGPLFAALWLAVGLTTAWRFHGQAIGVILGAEPETAYLARRLAAADLHFYWYRDYQALNRLLPRGSRLLLYESRGYYLNHDYDRYDLIVKREAVPQRLRHPDYVAAAVRSLGSTHVALWPTPQHATAYAPSNWLEDTLDALCASRWPVTYRSSTMILCRVTP